MFSLQSFSLLPAVLVSCLFFLTDVHAQQPVDLIIEGDRVTQALTEIPGNPDMGRQLVANRNKGNCLACHKLPIPEEPFHGNIGPSLVHIASKLSDSQIRLRLIDIKKINPMSIMPGYFKSSDQMTRIATQYENTTLLSAEEIEHIIAYLNTLKSQTTGLSQ